MTTSPTLDTLWNGSQVGSAKMSVSGFSAGSATIAPSPASAMPEMRTLSSTASGGAS